MLEASSSDLAKKQTIPGHVTLSALERYSGVTDKQKQNAIETLEFST
ncbi:hypothetical protein [Crocosphaera sp.]|nr:hypothetical protein [Crocosphaera sp.]NQZ65134.1 hypothetical protein [Crocosphaera sp.]